jgi:peptidoglycan/xylan/chitin deacetylase (PgdA/CDA1 family)
MTASAPRRMDNGYYDWSALPTRPPLRWPGGARVAVCVIVSLEQVEWLPGLDAGTPSQLVRFGPYPRVLDVHDISVHEYGNRVGVFRVMDVLQHHGVRATVAIDAALSLSNSFLVSHLQARGCEFAGHGLSGSRAITEEMGEVAERDYIRTSLDAIAEATGTRPQGWVGQDYAESTRTVRLLAEEGVRYVCDWPSDEQPFPMTVPGAEIYALPVTIDADEVITHRSRGLPMESWLRIVTDGFDQLYKDGARSGRLLVLNLHPFVIGQPFRIKYLKRALAHVLGHEEVWCATGGEIIDWYATVTAT